MANMTEALENSVVDGVSGVSTLLSPTMYLALLSADPTNAGLVTSELSGDGYTRISLAGKFPSASGGTVANTVLVTSPVATATWVEITHIGYCLGMTSGVADMQTWIQLSIPVIVVIGTTFELDIGGLTLTAL